MNNFFSWLVRSSEDQSKLALTIKGGLGMVVSIALIILPVFHVQADQSQLQEAADIVVQIVLGLATLVSTLATIAGFYRKLVNTFHKPNA